MSAPRLKPRQGFNRQAGPSREFRQCDAGGLPSLFQLADIVTEHEIKRCRICQLLGRQEFGRSGLMLKLPASLFGTLSSIGKRGLRGRRRLLGLLAGHMGFSGTGSSGRFGDFVQPSRQLRAPPPARLPARGRSSAGPAPVSLAERVRPLPDYRCGAGGRFLPRSMSGSRSPGHTFSAAKPATSLRRRTFHLPLPSRCRIRQFAGHGQRAPRRVGAEP